MDQQWNDNQQYNTQQNNGGQQYNAPQQYNVPQPYIPQQQYYAPPQYDTSKDGICMAALILGIVAFFINPIYAVSILAIIFGAMGMNSRSINASKAKVGLILGIASIGVQFIFDLLITIFTFGVGGISFCC